MCEFNDKPNGEREIVFTSEAPPDAQMLRRMLFEAENDPRSRNYKRKLVRPRINWAAEACRWILPVAAAVAVIIIWHSKPWVIAAALAALVIYYLVSIKALVISAVKLYQRFAPDKVRCKCRFEPSCSNYMLLAIEKYGFAKGFAKGVDRLKRCNINNGGIDEP